LSGDHVTFDGNLNLACFGGEDPERLARVIDDPLVDVSTDAIDQWRAFYFRSDQRVDRIGTGGTECSAASNDS
jgi:hypothetical protein